MNFLRALTIGERRHRVVTVADLELAVAEGAAYLAQGASYSYIRARSGMVAPRLMEDPDFGAAMNRCKWEGFAAAAADLELIVETELRPRAAAPGPFWRDLYRAVLAAHPVPDHRAASGWEDCLADFDARLDQHLTTPARGIEAIADHSARVIMDNAPVDEIIRDVDREMVMNNVKFRFIDHVTDLRRRIDWPGLAAAVSAAAEEGAQ